MSEWGYKFYKPQRKQMTDILHNIFKKEMIAWLHPSPEQYLTLLEYLSLMLLYAATPLQFREKHCPFYSKTFTSQQ